MWEHLLGLGRPVGHLEALVAVVHEGDRSPPRSPSAALARSRSDGFHAKLTQARSHQGGDHQLYLEMCDWLDGYDRDGRAGRDLAMGPSGEGGEILRADVELPVAGGGDGDIGAEAPGGLPTDGRAGVRHTLGGPATYPRPSSSVGSPIGWGGFAPSSAGWDADEERRAPPRLHPPQDDDARRQEGGRGCGT